MGTRKNSTDPKEESLKRSYAMARVFRGLLDIINDHNTDLTHKVVNHIRGFDQVQNEDSYENWCETNGFWRTILELIMRTYLQCCNNLGILLLSTIVVLTWPVRFLVELFSGMWFRHSVPPQWIEPDHANITPSMETAPEDSKVVRRVVYEEARVPKGDK